MRLRNDAPLCGVEDRISKQILGTKTANLDPSNDDAATINVVDDDVTTSLVPQCGRGVLPGCNIPIFDFPDNTVHCQGGEQSLQENTKTRDSGHKSGPSMVVPVAAIKSERSSGVDALRTRLDAGSDAIDDETESRSRAIGLTRQKNVKRRKLHKKGRRPQRRSTFTALSLVPSLLPSRTISMMNNGICSSDDDFVEDDWKQPAGKEATHRRAEFWPGLAASLDVAANVVNVATMRLAVHLRCLSIHCFISQPFPAIQIGEMRRFCFQL